MSDQRQYKRPESVLVIIHTPDRRFLLLERISPPGYWQSVTGSLRWDESPQQAAVRELHEETGFAADGLIDTGRRNRFPITPPWRTRYAPTEQTNLEHVFTLCLPEALPPVLNPDEHARFEWLDAGPAIARASSSTNREAIRQICRRACSH